MGGIIGDIGSALGTIGSDVGGALGKVGSTLGSVRGGPGTLIDAAMSGFGFLNNLFQQRQKQAFLNRLQDPRAMSQYVMGLERPLTAGSVAAAENAAQAQMGEHGIDPRTPLGAAVYSQALAPLYESQAARAAQIAESNMGTAGSIYANQQPTDISGTLSDLIERISKNPATAAGSGYDPNLSMTPGNIDWPNILLSPSASNLPSLEAVPPPVDTAGLMLTPDWSGIVSGLPSAGAFGGP